MSIPHDYERLSKECGYIPSHTDILGEVFAEFQFEMDGVYMSAQEVFSNAGFMPVFMFLAADRMKQLGLGKVEINHQDDDVSIAGFSAELEKGTPVNKSALFLLTMQSIAKEILGAEPAPDPIRLDALYSWVFSPDGPPPRLRDGGIPEPTSKEEVF